MQKFSSSLIFIIFLVYFSNVSAAPKIIKIGSGSVLEGYYSLGIKLCEYMKISNKGSKCEVIPTSGSVENIKLLNDKKIDFAIVQSNIALEAYKSLGHYENRKPFKKIKQVLNLHNEVYTIIVKDKDKIKFFNDIDGRNISNGTPDSGSSITYDFLRKYYKFNKEPKDFEISQEDYTKRFCAGNINVIMLMTGHPNALISHIAHNCEIDFVSLEKDKIDEIIKDNPAFRKTILSKGFYPGITEEQDTIEVSAILITRDKFDRKYIDNFIKYFNSKLESFKESNPILQNLNNEHFNNNFVLPKY